MVKLNSKIEASTLQETIIAMSIILFVFSIALLVFTNIIRSENQRLDFKGNMLLEEYFVLNQPADDHYEDTYDELPQLHIERLYYPYSSDNELMLMQVNIIGLNGKLIASQKEIIQKKSVSKE
jgi:hypothetical protein